MRCGAYLSRQEHARDNFRLHYPLARYEITHRIFSDRVFAQNEREKYTFSKRLLLTHIGRVLNRRK